MEGIFILRLVDELVPSRGALVDDLAQVAEGMFGADGEIIFPEEVSPDVAALLERLENLPRRMRPLGRKVFGRGIAFEGEKDSPFGEVKVAGETEFFGGKARVNVENAYWGGAFHKTIGVTREDIGARVSFLLRVYTNRKTVMVVVSDGNEVLSADFVDEGEGWERQSRE